MQEFATPHSLRNGIFDLLSSVNLASEENVKLLDYTIELFNKNGLSSDYYGYHNIDHELEVTYVTLISAVSALNEKKFTLNDVRYLYASALLHDFDPEKSVDKPHEKGVINFINNDIKIQKLLENANIDSNIICALISRTVYPWSGKVKTIAEQEMKNFFQRSPETRDNPKTQEHFFSLGHFLSIADRVYFLRLGEIVSSGKASELKDTTDFKKIYFGE